MKLKNLFNHIMGKEPNDPSRSEGELLISSDTPYEPGSIFNDGFEQIKTFTENITVKTEAMAASVKIPAKVIYDGLNRNQLVLYLPDSTTNLNIRNIKQGQKVDLWLFLDNGEFFINFPEEVDPYVDEELFITSYRIKLGNTGFHSVLKNLREKYSFEEISDILSDELSQHDIVEIEVKVLSQDNSTPKCPLVTVSSSTSSMLGKAFKAVSEYDN